MTITACNTNIMNPAHNIVTKIMILSRIIINTYWYIYIYMHVLYVATYNIIIRSYVSYKYTINFIFDYELLYMHVIPLIQQIKLKCTIPLLCTQHYISELYLDTLIKHSINTVNTEFF